MSRFLKLTFLLHAIVGVLFGLPLLLAPGQFLGAFGWAPVDPLISRMFGAALIGLAWGSVRAWGQASHEKVLVLIEVEAVFSLLALAGLLRHLVFARWPMMVWVVAGLFAIFAGLWVVGRLHE
jgi:hypothetical protein